MSSRRSGTPRSTDAGIAARHGRWFLLLALIASPLAARPLLEPEILTPVGALPAHVTGKFEDPTGFQQSPDGDYFIFDRRSHSVFAYKPGTDAPRKVIQIGAEKGRVIQPSAFDFAPDNTFVVADSPGRLDRIQIFMSTGSSLGGFALGSKNTARLIIDNFVLSGVGSLEYTGDAIFISQPETGAVITEYGVDGRTRRSFGDLRQTGHENDPDVHAALNGGLPLVNPRGGFYFVFVAGAPVFRKYDASGKLLFERHIEGIELDSYLATLPTTWRPRRTAEGELPVIRPTIRTAAVDGDGNLWISLAVPFTYVYDSSGDKRRVVQFRATGAMSATSLSFTRDGKVLVTPGCYSFAARRTG
jgi:hypothetical protein